MKPRSTLNAAEASALVEYLERRLEGAGLATQPEVASRILTLVCDPGASLLDYAAAIGADASLAGRLLRLANSALFAQRQPVTSLERACVLLGLERLKAVSLGFYLSRTAASEAASPLSRRIWGESLFRACLMSELARKTASGHIAEAFVIGLMMDAGLPFLAKWLGPASEDIIRSEPSPAAQFHAEFHSLPFTHVDIAAALARRWKLPELLSRPIERHHNEPSPRARCEPVHQLHKLAFCVGILRLDVHGEIAETTGEAPAVEKVLGISGDGLGESVRRAAQEFHVMMEVFRDVAWMASDVDAVAQRAHQQLVEVMDELMISQLRRESRAAPESFSVSGQHIEIECIQPGQVVAYLSDSRGRRLLSHAFNPADQSARVVLEALGIDDCRGDQSAELENYLRSLAA
jgi:HD-like signal output (HDOD) protein